MQSLESALRNLRIIHIALLASIPLYAFAGEFLEPVPRDVSRIHRVLLVLLVAELGAVTVIRSRIVAPAQEALRLPTPDPGEVQRWFTGSFISYVICEAVTLLGLVLRFLGGTFAQAAPFYAAGFVLLLFLAPRNPAHQ